MPSDEALKAAVEIVDRYDYTNVVEDEEHEVAEIIDRHMGYRINPETGQCLCSCHPQHGLTNLALSTLLVEAAETIEHLTPAMAARNLVARLRKAAEEMK